MPGTESAVVQGLKSRNAAGLPLDQFRLRNDNAGLAIRASQLFGQISKALNAAGLKTVPHNFRSMHFKSAEEVLTALRLPETASTNKYRVLLQFLQLPAQAAGLAAPVNLIRPLHLEADEIKWKFCRDV